MFLISKMNIAIILYEEKKNRKEAAPLFMQAYHIFKEIGSPDQQMALNYLERIKGEIGEKRFWRIVGRGDYSEISPQY